MSQALECDTSSYSFLLFEVPNFETRDSSGECVQPVPASRPLSGGEKQAPSAEAPSTVRARVEARLV